ncbi:MAG: hypothetical protein FWF80_04105 [Defluviitaleaceae bacterium]|nr:hypothetical protein [Defluviitaleaceae bacterium]
MLVKKMFVAFCFVVLAAIGFTVPVVANTFDDATTATFFEIEPLWTNTLLITAELHVSGTGQVIMSGSVLGQPGTSSISVNAVLERVNENGTVSPVVSFNNIRTASNVWDWSRTQSVTRGHSYRMRMTATVVRNGISEVITVSSRTVWVG